MLRVLTYNIWFSDFIADERLQSLKKIVNNTEPHIICLQEVREYIYEEIHKMFDDYIIKPDVLDQKYDSIILVKKTNDIDFDSYSVIEYEHSIMMRNLHVVKLTYKNVPFLIGNSHFESIFDSADERIKLKYLQYKQAKDILNDVFRSNNEELILCCDSNLTSEGVEIFNQIYHDWTDAWINDEEGFTYDTCNNPYLKRINKEIRFRLDRILKHGNRTKIKSTQVVNKTMSGVKKEVSDHYGVLTHLEIL